MTYKVYAASSNQSCQLMQSEKLLSTSLGNTKVTIMLISFLWYPQSQFDYIFMYCLDGKSFSLVQIKEHIHLANAKKNCTKKSYP